ncbi:MAG TPA: hypothetical protein VMA75_01615 [Candidatus Paceibacterota bacterium]|nr:hypothetical protein [Candidatus Paceibacterota bacterium]
MNPEKIDGRNGSEVPLQMDFDFDEAAVKARAKELRDKHGWTEPYAMSVAKREFERTAREERSGGKEKVD